MISNYNKLYCNKVFPNIILIGCYFHHKQALIRIAAKLGLAKKEQKFETKILINKELGILPFKSLKIREKLKII